jgi:ABC-type uncharacterized transport system ATPase subunit
MSGREATEQQAAAKGDLLVAERVRKEFGGLLAVNDLDFTIPRARIVSLIGPERRRQDDLLQHA